VSFEDYAEAHTTPHEPHLAQLFAETHASLTSPQMLTGQLEGRFLEFLVYMTLPELVLEIGTYSGYSALSMARALPPGGRIVTCEVDPERAAFARRHLGEDGRIQVKLGPALDTIAGLDGRPDLVFIDADKEGYVDYYEAALDKLAPRGIIVADNTLGHERNEALARFNEHVAADPRTVQVVLPIRDGVTLIRRT
jgi:caffeoyl-CoA O-methyltransferase